MKKTLFLSVIIILFSCKGTSQEKEKRTTEVNKNTKIINVKELDINEKEFKNSKVPILDFDKVNDHYYSFTKESNKLELELNNRKKITFEDNEGVPYDENLKTYNLINDFKDLDKYLIRLNEYEQTHYLLLDRNSGVIDSLSGIPFLSIDKKYIFSTYYNQYNEPFSQEIFLYRIVNNRLSLFFQKDYTGLELISFYWKNKNSLNLKFKKNDEYIFKELILVE